MTDINIILPPRSRSSAATRRRGPVRLRQPYKKRPRRLKKGNGIRFFDLGRIWSEPNWVDIDLSAAPSYSIDSDSPNRLTILPNISNLYDQFLTNLLLDMPESWESKYQELTFDAAKEYYIGVSPTTVTDTPNYQRLDTDNPNWTDQGLKFEGSNISLGWVAQESYVISSPLFCSFWTGHSSVKITETPVYTDVSAAVLASEIRKIFLVPFLGNNYSYVSTGVFTGAHAELLAEFGMMPRYWLGKQDLGSIDILSRISDDSVDLSHINNVNSILKNKSGALRFRSESPDFHATLETPTSSFPNVSPANELNVGFSSFVGDFTAMGAVLTNQLLISVPPVGSLIGVMQTNSKTYYCWLNEDDYYQAQRFETQKQIRGGE